MVPYISEVSLNTFPAVSLVVTDLTSLCLPHHLPGAILQNTSRSSQDCPPPFVKTSASVSSNLLTDNMRLPYAPSTILPEHDEFTTAIYNRILSQRPSGNFLPLDLTLLHSPKVAEGFYTFNRTIHRDTQTSKSLLELAICRVAILNSSSYGWNTHGMIALKSELAPEILKIVMTLSTEDVQASTKPSQLSQLEYNVLKYTDEVTNNVKVTTGTFESLKSSLGEREIVELTVTIGTYNAVNRVLVPLEVGLEDERNGKMKTVEELLEELGKTS